MRCEPLYPPHSDTRRRPPTRPIPRKLEFVGILVSNGLEFGPGSQSKQAGFRGGDTSEGEENRRGAAVGEGGEFSYTRRGSLRIEFSILSLYRAGGFWKEGRGVQEV